MILDFDDLKQSISEDALLALVKDCVLSMGDFSDAAPEQLNFAIEQALQKIKSGKLLVEYGENSETFALVEKSKLAKISKQ